MPHSSTISLLRYWRSLQIDPQWAPFRSQFDPSQLKPLLSQMMMITDRDFDYRFRMSGGFLNTLFAKTLKDETLLSLFSSPFHQPILMALEKAVDREAPLILTAAIPMTSKQITPPQKDIELEFCLCPLKNAQGLSDRFIGLVHPQLMQFSEIKGELGPLSLKSALLQGATNEWRPAHLSLVVSRHPSYQPHS